MSTLVRLEFYKCRRRQIFLICAGLLGAELVWFGVYLARQDPEDLLQGWMLTLYNLAMVDAILFPLGTAVLASRNCEIEHKGATLKLLETATTPGRLYAAKLIWGALVLGAVSLVRTVLFVLLGIAMEFPGGVPWSRFAWFTLITWGVSMALFFSSRGCPSALPTRPSP